MIHELSEEISLLKLFSSFHIGASFCKEPPHFNNSPFEQPHFVEPPFPKPHFCTTPLLYNPSDTAPLVQLPHLQQPHFQNILLGHSPPPFLFEQRPSLQHPKYTATQLIKTSNDFCCCCKTHFLKQKF